MKKIIEFALFQALLFAIIGLIAGILYSFGGLIIDTAVSLNWLQTAETPGLSIGTVLAFGALLGMPLLFAIFGFLLGIVEWIVYKSFIQRFIKFDFTFSK